MQTRPLCWLAVAIFLGVGLPLHAEIAQLRLRPAIRRPVALAASGSYVFCANSRTGSVSIIDRSSQRVVAEHPVASSLIDLATHPGDEDAFAVDDRKHRLLALRYHDGELSVREVAALPHSPRSLAVDVAARRVLVTSCWSRQLTILEFDRSFQSILSRRSIPLNFPAGELLVLPDERLMIADAFSGNLALADIHSAKILREWDLPAHNIRGMALSPNKQDVLISHQSLDPSTWADFDGVHWGLVIANSLRGVQLGRMLNGSQKAFEDTWVDAIGLTGDGAGDPGALLVDDQRRTILAIAGVGEVMIDSDAYRQRVRVGRRPSALLSVDDVLFVANQFDDTISVIDLEHGGRALPTIALGPRAELAAADRGEEIFFSAKRAHQRWMSCHSCHSEGHTIDLTADTLGDGGYGAPKRIPSLLNAAATGPWAWNGGVDSLTAQVRKSIRTTMHGRELSDAEAHDLVAFLKTLNPPPPPTTPPPALVAKGRELFHREACVDCHKPPYFTSQETFDIGLTDEQGNRVFNPPSLIGLSQRRAFFHDSRFRRIEDILTKANHPRPLKISEAERNALLAFLKSL